MRLLFALALFFVLSGVATDGAAQVVEIRGSVRSTDGKPVEGVYISVFGKTDEGGRFKIASDVLLKYWKTLVFDKEGFVPQAVRLDASKTDLDITLEPEREDSRWEIPTCGRTNTGRDRLVGTYLKIPVPRGLKFKSGVDTDYLYYSVEYRNGGEKSWLRGGLGPLYAGVYPDGELLLRSPNYTYRRTSVGIDWRGRTEGGKYWRHFGAPSVFDIYHYETDSREAADAFDKILDRVCFQPGR